MTQEQITELKAKYGKIFKITINNVDWYYRPMSRIEFKNYSAQQMENADKITEFDLEDMIFDICSLNNIKSTDMTEAGVVTILASAIMKSTGFTENIEPEEL